MKLLWHKTTTKIYGDPLVKNEDVFSCVKQENNICRFVMCDGATTSYSARAWAKALVSNFVSKGDLSAKDRVYAAAHKYEAQHPPIALSGMDYCTIEAFKRGSSATLLLVVQDEAEPKLVHITAVGDTCCFVVDDKYHVLKSFPLSDPQDFSTSAYLITVTFEGLKQLFDEKTSGLYWKRIDLDMNAYPKAKLICATDAVSQWITANKNSPESISSFLQAVASKRKNFVRFIENERKRKLMSVDDSSVAVLEV